MVELVNSLKLEKFSIVGHDWGAVLAWGLAFMCPDRVERLVVVSVGYLGKWRSWHLAVSAAYDRELLPA
jgi:pimeloyl-ACP methyl ester carboxylesterase